MVCDVYGKGNRCLGIGNGEDRILWRFVLDEAFMSDIFSNIMEGDNKLEPLEEYIIHMFGKYSIQISLRIICLINLNI